MTLKELGEFGLLDALAVDRVRLPAGWIGPGDDAAVLYAPAGPLLFTSDLLLEGRHFRLETTPAADLGYKAVAVNASDVAAMGGRPLACTVSLTAPSGLPVEWLKELYAGFSEASAEFGCPLVGGDTSSGDRVFLSLALLGVAAAKGAVLRSGARPGDRVYVSGSPGESALGLKLLEEGAALESPAHRHVVSRHRRPAPRLALGAALGDAGLASAMIDVSDGLLQDLGHILERSRVGAKLAWEAIPLSPDLREVAARRALDPMPFVLAGGEDYELLLTAPPENEAALREAAAACGIGLSAIGEIEEEPGLRLTKEGRPASLPEVRGYDHFRNDSE
ncbi:MAG: thiamine-phosphate kinase [Deltaproteobacteria bacterium]|nr:thiamine-phosphate kinase [Deltaproteobacteria bacterium]